MPYLWHRFASRCPVFAVSQTSPRVFIHMMRRQHRYNLRRQDLKNGLLAPDIVEAIVEGQADDRVMLKVLVGTSVVDHLAHDSIFPTHEVP